MTLAEYIKILQEIEADGKGDYELFSSDWLGSDPPEPEVSDYYKETII